MSISDDLLKTLFHSYMYVFFQKQSLLKWYPCLGQVINFYSVAYLLFMVKIQQNIDIYYYYIQKLNQIFLPWRNLHTDFKLLCKLLRMLCIFRCCRMCNISLSESISHVEPGILVFDCGKEILYLSNEMIFLFKIIIAFFHRHNGFIYHQILLHILKQRLQNMYRLFYFTKSTFKGTYQKNDCKYKHCKIYC